MTNADLRRVQKRYRLSPGIIALNSDTVGAVVAQKQQPPPEAALVEKLPRRCERQGSVGYRVLVVACRSSLCDDDNSRAGYKALQDAIAATLGIDDGRRDRISFEYQQITTATDEGTLVKIEKVLC